jgi:hypothetical protein
MSRLLEGLGEEARDRQSDLVRFAELRKKPSKFSPFLPQLRLLGMFSTTHPTSLFNENKALCALVSRILTSRPLLREVARATCDGSMCSST